jgi:hypothetical protein
MIATSEIHEVFPAGDERDLVAVFHLSQYGTRRQGAQKNCRNDCSFAFHEYLLLWGMLVMGRV